MAAPATIVKTNMTINDKGKITVETSLKALGVFGLYVSELSNYTVDKNFLIMILKKVIPRDCVAVSKQCKKVLEIDVEKAWKELGLNGGWNNEVNISIMIIPS